MNMKFKDWMNALLIIIILILNYNCNQSKIDSTKLANEFYELNKDKNFDELFDVSIGGGRINSVYIDSINQYELFFKTIALYDIKSDGYITIPFFIDTTNETKDSIFKNLDNQTKIFLFDKFGATSEMDLFNSYFKYLNKVIVQYNQIETPKWYSYKNVATMGNSRLGRFIIFSLNTPNKIVRCYYIKDFNSLSKYWSNYFKEINKLENNKWYWDQIEIN